MRVNRYLAFAGHLLGSVVVGLLMAVLIFWVWYPWPLPIATGVTQVFVLLVAVDAVIGPCITFVVFNPAKKELKRDLAIVVLLQMFALAYGMHALFIARPVYIVFNADRFDLVLANDMSEEKLKKVSDGHFRTLPVDGPEVIAARKPDDQKVANSIFFQALAGGDDLPQLPEYYVPYKMSRADVLKHILPLSSLKEHNNDQQQTIKTLVDTYAQNNGAGYLPLRGKVKDLTVIVDSKTGEIIEIMDLRPWD